MNLLGCLLVGALAAVFAPPGRLHDALPLQMVLMTGLLGGFTTFSAFALEALLLLERGATGAAAAYVLASVLGGLAATGAAYAGVTLLLR